MPYRTQDAAKIDEDLSKVNLQTVLEKKLRLQEVSRRNRWGEAAKLGKGIGK